MKNFVVNTQHLRPPWAQGCVPARSKTNNIKAIAKQHVSGVQREVGWQGKTETGDGATLSKRGRAKAERLAGMGM